MSVYVERTCTETGGNKPISLEDYRERDAYVLLGGPGSGKTRSLKEEARRTPSGLYVSAHDFVELERLDAWHGKTLFIDALDELRADSPSPEPLGRIRKRLDDLGRPRFRLACRDADWYSAVDRDSLAVVSKSGQMATLKINPLADDEVRKLLAALEIDSPDRFTNLAAEDGVSALLRNPLSLLQLVRARGSGVRPQSRKEAFGASSLCLLREENERHEFGRGNERSGLTAQLHAASQLCAVALLAGKRGYLWRTTEREPSWIRIEDVPGDSEVFKSVLRTRLFESPKDGRFAPAHRHMAEYLAGMRLANAVAAGLPVDRAKALMVGFDGGVVSSLRGVWGWFAAHCQVARTELIDGDPLGVALYGDVKDYSVEHKRRLLDGVSRMGEEAMVNMPIDCWQSTRWADIATANAAGLVREVFSQASASEEHQLLALLLVDAPQRRVFPELKPMLLSIVRDARLYAATRRGALQSLIVQFRDEPELEGDIDQLLTDIGAGRVTDDDDELTGRLLCELYPRRRSLGEVREYLHPPKRPSLVGHYWHFWTTLVCKGANEAEKLEARQLSARFRQWASEMTYDDEKEGMEIIS